MNKKNDLIQYRNEDLTETHIVKETGLSQTTIYKLEKGITDPRLSVVKKYLEVNGYELIVRKKTNLKEN